MAICLKLIRTLLTAESSPSYIRKKEHALAHVLIGRGGMRRKVEGVKYWFRPPECCCFGIFLIFWVFRVGL